MARTKHSKKDIEAALKHAEEHGWRIELSNGHPYGKMYCPSIPKLPGNAGFSKTISH